MCWKSPTAPTANCVHTSEASRVQQQQRLAFQVKHTERAAHFVDWHKGCERCRPQRHVLNDAQAVGHALPGLSGQREEWVGEAAGSAG